MCLCAVYVCVCTSSPRLLNRLTIFHETWYKSYASQGHSVANVQVGTHSERYQELGKCKGTLGRTRVRKPAYRFCEKVRTSVVYCLTTLAHQQVWSQSRGRALSASESTRIASNVKCTVKREGTLKFLSETQSWVPSCRNSRDEIQAS